MKKYQSPTLLSPELIEAGSRQFAEELFGFLGSPLANEVTVPVLGLRVKVDPSVHPDSIRFQTPGKTGPGLRLVCASVEADSDLRGVTAKFAVMNQQ